MAKKKPAPAPKCKICGSLNVTPSPDGQPIRCHNCGWTSSKVRKAPA